jgi:uncharacterized protein YjbI with pentapeptide repeats
MGTGNSSWPDELTELFDRVKSIPANDEIELRIAIHDIHHFATERAEDYQQIDRAMLELCSDLIYRTSQHIQLDESPPRLKQTLEQHRNKTYIRSINALIRTLLQQLEHPQQGLCLDTLQLQQCKLDHIDLSYASMRMTDLSHCRLARSNLSQSDLRFANLMSASLARSNLSQALFEACDMAWCDLSHTDLHRSQLMHTDLGGSILEHADLSASILSGANLNNATLTSANLNHANLFAAKLHAAKLYGADLSGTGITPERLENMGMHFYSDKGTIWGDKQDCGGRNPLDPAYYHEQQQLI